MSVVASMISRAGTCPPVVTGCSELEMTARNLTLLRIRAGILSSARQPGKQRASRQKLKANLLKPGTPNGMQDKDLDARKRDYIRGILEQPGIAIAGIPPTVDNVQVGCRSCILIKMAGNFLERLKKAPILCDGAMGTLLYAKGIFINRCYDELNVSQPELIRGIHMITYNPAQKLLKPIRLARIAFGWRGIVWRTSPRNQHGRRALAREAAKSFDVWVGRIGRPTRRSYRALGKISFEEARDAFREQIAALAEGGVDLIILETFGYLEEFHQAILAAREVNPEHPRRGPGHH